MTQTLTGQTLTGLFDRYDDARRAVQDLEAAGVPHRDVSIVASNGRGEHAAATDPAGDAGAGAGIGAAIGGAGGLLAGLGLLAIPGLGPVVAAGWLAATAVGVVGGAAIGGAAGGLVGALTDAGVPADDAHVYAEGVRRGGTLVTAKVDEKLVPTARAILGDQRAVDVGERRDHYRLEGWTAFDEHAPAYTPEQIDAERDRYDRVTR
ncbi:hypothetical protein [Sphingomonas sp.]|uniref:hypothetical protein n=1 Tax=Sphingomonas sp. TaxID=28214 RepID=UPI003B005E3E